MAEPTTTGASKMLDVAAVSARLGCSWRHVMKMAERGEMPTGRKLGHLRRWDSAEIEQWIADGCPRVRPQDAQPQKAR